MKKWVGGAVKKVRSRKHSAEHKPKGKGPASKRGFALPKRSEGPCQVGEKPEIYQRMEAEVSDGSGKKSKKT